MVPILPRSPCALSSAPRADLRRAGEAEGLRALYLCSVQVGEQSPRLRSHAPLPCVQSVRMLLRLPHFLVVIGVDRPRTPPAWASHRAASVRAQLRLLLASCCFAGRSGRAGLALLLWSFPMLLVVTTALVVE